MNEIKHKKNYLPLFAGLIGLVIILVAFGYFIYDSRQVKQQAKADLIKRLTESECYTTPNNIDILKDIHQITFQCFKVNKQVVLLVDRGEEAEFDQRFNLNNKMVKATNRAERILLISAPDVYKEQCEKNQQKAFCEFTKTKPHVMYAYL